MVVGVCEVSVAIQGARSLKDKRRVMRRLIERTRARFEIAIAETGSNDSLRMGRIGFSIVSNESRHAESQLDKVLHFMRELYVADIVNAEREIFHWSEPLS